MIIHTTLGHQTPGKAVSPSALTKLVGCLVAALCTLFTLAALSALSAFFPAAAQAAVSTSPALTSSGPTSPALTSPPAHATSTPAQASATPTSATPTPATSRQLAALLADTTKGKIAATAALTQLGVSFSWGGGSAKGPTLGIGRGARTRGFDCSGLTLYAWSRAGIKLSHYTGAQFRQGRRIALRARRMGDLLFFGGGTGDPTHVALFLHGGLMIHSPKTGDVVKKTNFLTSSYFRTTFRGAVRPG
ncbi:hypothetical protein GCM10022419_102350 [Nonomuraea rosea]|uniref:NlpC/P60 domain-containing protein n=1 Tax=Nonomuraea rosea TaxID=638574 RepID=A0ABP6Z9R7_9ACTN